ncbi:MAG: hypothetical protein K2Y18_09130 [Alphaproteobacteria bacterium]|jgi:hypothetical protein|nr:hypothetical protein [Alphaproteobacteria bacterium]
MKNLSKLMLVVGTIGIGLAVEDGEKVPFTPGFDILVSKKGSTTNDIMLDEKGVPFTPVMGDGTPDFVTPVMGSSPCFLVPPKEWRLMYAGNTPYHPEGLEGFEETEEHQVDEEKEARFLTGGSPLNLSPGVDLARELFTPSTDEEIKKNKE